jgi:hypothetical protein
VVVELGRRRIVRALVTQGFSLPAADRVRWEW